DDAVEDVAGAFRELGAALPAGVVEDADLDPISALAVDGDAGAAVVELDAEGAGCGFMDRLRRDPAGGRHVPGLPARFARSKRLDIVAAQARWRSLHAHSSTGRSGRSSSPALLAPEA